MPLNHENTKKLYAIYYQLFVFSEFVFLWLQKTG